MKSLQTKWWSKLLAVLLALAVTGCGGKTAPDQPREPGPARDEVTVGFPSVPSSFDPLNGFANGVQLLFSALVQTTADMEIAPDLAVSYTVSEDARTYTFRLREDARFSDGTPVTVEDVVFSYETAMGNATSLDLSRVESVASEGSEIVIRLKRPDSTFILTAASVGIVPKASYGEDFALNPVSSGPYKLVQYDVDQQFILEANEYYYGEAPGIRRAVFVKMADPDTRLLAVRSGQVDITLTSAVAAASNTVDGYCLLEEKTVDNFGISLPVLPDEGRVNGDGHPVGNDVTSDIAVRKALAYGIDRQRVCDEALNGYAVPAYSENDGMPWYNPESEIPFDPDYARALLEEAGWTSTGSDGVREKDGVRASISLLYFAGDDIRQVAAMSVSNQALENLGIEILVEGAGEDLSARMFSEPMILAWGSSNPRTSYMLFHSSNAGKTDWYNPENFTSETVDGWLEAALHANSLEEAIPYWQKAQWDGETGTSMRGECPYVFLLNKTHLYWVREGLDTGVQKIHAHGDAWPLVENLRCWRWT